MLKREFKINKKSLIIWISVCIFLYLMVFLVYPSITNNENIDAINQMVEIFPESVLKAFNMDIASISSVFGWFKTEGYMYLSLVLGIYASILGSTILLKEENDKTIEFLYAKPLKRKDIVTAKILCGIINISIFIIIITIFNLIGMALSNDLELKLFLLLSLSPILTSLSLFFVSMLVSTFLHKTKNATSLAFALVFISYFLQIVSLLSDKVKFLKYLSFFTLSEARTIILNGRVDYINILIAIVISLICSFFIFYKYKRKELV